MERHDCRVGTGLRKFCHSPPPRDISTALEWSSTTWPPTVSGSQSSAVLSPDTSASLSPLVPRSPAEVAVLRLRQTLRGGGGGLSDLDGLTPFTANGFFLESVVIIIATDVTIAVALP